MQYSQEELDHHAENIELDLLNDGFEYKEKYGDLWHGFTNETGVTTLADCVDLLNYENKERELQALIDKLIRNAWCAKARMENVAAVMAEILAPDVAYAERKINDGGCNE